jgi:metallo-beta-lactamase family protein
MVVLAGAPAEARHHRAQSWRQPQDRVAVQAPLPQAQPAAAGCRIRFLGAAGGVTGSMHLLEVNGRRLLVDCGMRQGKDRGQLGDRCQVPSEAVAADAMLLTHAHVDHSGDIPLLVKNGFRGKIYCTPGTAALCQALLPDSARLQERKSADAARRGQQIAPRYSMKDVATALTQLEAHPVGETFSPAPGINVCFSEAGHLLGAASPVVSVSVNGQQRRIAFSGDLGRRQGPLLKDPVPPQGVDYVVMESTYGNRVHGATQDQKAQLLSTIEETRRRGGKVIIPAFSVDRTQQLLVLLKQLQLAGLNVPVYVDSPLSASVTRLYREHTEAHGEKLRAFAREHGDPFSFPNLKIVGSVEESKDLARLQGPAVIISAPGMANGGRIQHHLINNIGDPRNTVVVVSYMSEGTPGRAIRDGASQVCLLGQQVPIRAQVKVLDSFSGHADKTDLLWWAGSCGRQVKKIFLVHGDPDQTRGLADELTRQGKQVVVPSQGEVRDLD